MDINWSLPIIVDAYTKDGNLYIVGQGSDHEYETINLGPIFPENILKNELKAVKEELEEVKQKIEQKQDKKADRDYFSGRIEEIEEHRWNEYIRDL